MTIRKSKTTAKKSADKAPAKKSASPQTKGPKESVKSGKTKSGSPYVAHTLEDGSISVTFLSSPEGGVEYSTRVNSLDELE